MTGEPTELSVTDPYLITIAAPTATTLVEAAPTAFLVPCPGIPGNPGPPNKLSIGTVTAGDVADASITGEPPDQELNLVLPRGPQGASGNAAPVTGETPTGIQDGVNEVFTLANRILPGSTAVYRNGLREIRGIGYDETGTSAITFTTAPLPGDVLTVDYLIGA